MLLAFRIMEMKGVPEARIRQVAALCLHNIGILYGTCLGNYKLVTTGKWPDYLGAGLAGFYCSS